MNNIKLAEETVGQIIKAQRIKKGLSQENLAELMHVSFKTISAYERDQIDIKSSVIMELCNALDTTPNYLMGYENRNEIDIETENIMVAFGKISNPKVKELFLMQLQNAVYLEI